MKLAAEGGGADETYGADDLATIISGASRIITRLDIQVEGSTIPMSKNVDMSIALRNLLRFSSYGDSLACVQFFYPDDNTGLPNKIINNANHNGDLDQIIDLDSILS